MSPALALLLLACSPDPVEEQGPPPEAPPSFVVQQTPPPAPTPPLASPAAGVPPEAVSVVFGLGAPGGGLISDVGAQRVRLTDGQPLWAADHVVVVSGSAYHERRPAVVPDQAGGFVAVYEAEVPEGPLKGDVDLLVQRVDAEGRRLWEGGERSALLATTPVLELAPRLVADDAGGAFVIFERHGRDEADRLDSDLAVQRLDADGRALWAEGAQHGVAVAAGAGLVSNATARADGQGGLLVAFEYEPVDGPRAGLGQIRAQRFDPRGQPLWGREGQPLLVAAASGGVDAPALLPDGEGGALVFFREAVSDGEHAGEHDVMCQRVSPGGGLSWGGGPEAFKVVSATTLDEGPPVLVSDGAQGAIVAFEATWLEGPRRGEMDLFAQRIDPMGLGLWNQGAPLPVASSDWQEHSPRIVSDGAGGAIVVFEQKPPPAHLSDDQDLGAQRIGPDGRLLWHGGERSAVLSATTHLERAPSIASDGAGGVVVFFEALARAGEHQGDIEIVAQRLDPEGARLWGQDDSPRLIAWSAALEREPVVVLP